MHTGEKVKKLDLLGAGRNQSQNTGRGQNNRKTNKGKIQSQSQREHGTRSKLGNQKYIEHAKKQN